MSVNPENTSTPETGRLGITARLETGLLGGALIGGFVAAFSPGPFLSAWLAAWLLSSVGLFFLLTAFIWGGRDRALAWLMAVTFLLRLGLGIGLSQALPIWGYDEKAQQAGYLFKDAYFRDQQAWELARSNQPLEASFREGFTSDQYGGLLALSALIYRYFSPDAHRPYLILILGAFFATLGVPFLRAAVRSRWSTRITALTAWIYALYPDAVFFGSSQMREPFLVGLGAIAFWAVLTWQWRKLTCWLALIGSLAGMALISVPVTAAYTGFLGLLFLVEYVVSLPDRRWKALGWAALALGLLAVLAFSWEWFRSSSSWDLLVTWRNSGQISAQIKVVGEQWAIPMELAYGVARPVLPAAITDADSGLLWRMIGVLRSLGWYVLAPFLIYSLFSLWKEKDPAVRRRFAWLALVVFLWLLIAAARGGADSTDNPRYRSLMIAWLALLAAWAIDWALSHRDAWLWRWIAVEAICLGFFTQWYVSRYYRLWAKMPFWQMVALIALLSGLVLVGGWVWDRLRGSKIRFPNGVK